MIAGLSGSLLSHDALEGLLRSPARAPLALAAAGPAGERLAAWHASLRDRLGPSSGARTIFDTVAEPLVRTLGFDVLHLSALDGTVDALLQAGGQPAAVMVVVHWGHPLSSVWRHAVHRGLAHHTRWCLCSNGQALRLIDAHRPYSGRYAEFDLALSLEDDGAREVVCGVLKAVGGGRALGEIVAHCERHRSEVRVSLREGVHHALLSLVTAFRASAPARAEGRFLSESLTVVHRILFLLFAEARALVPAWHPVYRDAYTVESLREPLERALVPRGVWEALQAMTRLAHGGARAGALRVPPFNGRLFSLSDAPLADTVPLDDEQVGCAVISLTTRQGEGGRERISYADLGVEQLGAVYEHLLDYDLAPGERQAPAVLVPTGRRKATGSFYTPRPLTEFLVRRTLAPLVRGLPPERILGLRVLDPAMGSGAFLVAACRFLAGAYEQALIDEGALTAGDISEADRAGFRRLVAQRCLYGVDINPMAVQLGRLSLWLATLAADKPLTFLDHHLRVGNSLVGGSIEDIRRQPSPGRPVKRPEDLPLFPFEELQSSLGIAITARLALGSTPDDTLEQVKTKERALSSLNRPGGPLERWRIAADLWCASWFCPAGAAPDRRLFRTLLDRVLKDDPVLPGRVTDGLLERARGAAESERFFHWPFEFPEIFYDERGVRPLDAGFDAILGNPPWEMLRDDGGGRTRELSGFVRGSTVYRLQGPGHPNLYPLFVERVLQLLRPGGRAGLILPSGFASDQSCGALRRSLLDRTSVDTFTTLENRDGLFPVHRGLKFLLLTLTNDGSTPELPARPGVRAPDVLDGIPDSGEPPGDRPVALSRSLIERVSGGSLAVPEIRSSLDLEIVSSITFRVRACGDEDGWNIRFGRELNATDDRPFFVERGPGIPVIEGKLLRAFGVHEGAARFRVPARVAARLLDPRATFERARLAYRDVASSANRTTLIAAIVPAGVVTTHTVFCVKERLDDESQQFLCGVFNSYVANYLVRMRVGTHVTAGIVARLPVPKPLPTQPSFRRVAGLSRLLARRPDAGAFARMNAIVAGLYGLSGVQFAHVLSTFPLVPAAERAEALRHFEAERVS